MELSILKTLYYSCSVPSKGEAWKLYQNQIHLTECNLAGRGFLEKLKDCPDYFDLECEYTVASSLHEMQGFINGFRLAMQFGDELRVTRNNVICKPCGSDAEAELE